MAPFREIASGLRFPEGPVALPDGSVLVVEIARGTLTRVSPEGRVEVVAECGGGPNGAALGPDGKVYVTNNGGFEWIEGRHGLRPHLQAKSYAGGSIQRVDLATGAVETLYTEGPNDRLRGPNDLVFDTHGGFWFTDLGKTRERDWDRGALYYAKADGSEIREVVHPLITPNGVGLSPDGKRLYVAETQTARVWAFDLAGPGEIVRHRWPPSPNGALLLFNAQGYQLFDSLAVDSAGNVCVATIMNGGVTVIAPDGRLVEHVALPDLYVTNICFGGPQMRTAYVTLSGSGRLIALDWPRPGLRLNYG